MAGGWLGGAVGAATVTAAVSTVVMADPFLDAPITSVRVAPVSAEPTAYVAPFAPGTSAPLRIHRYVMSNPATPPQWVAVLSVPSTSPGAGVPVMAGVAVEAGAMMALGGLISLADRRFRVAAGARRRPVQAVAAE